MSSKYRVYEIAKALNKKNEDVIELLRKNNIEVKSHLSGVGEAERELVEKFFREKKAEPKKETPAKPAVPKQTEIKPQVQAKPAAPQGEKLQAQTKPAAPQGEKPQAQAKPAAPQGEKPQAQTKPQQTARPPQPGGERPQQQARPAVPQGQRPPQQGRQQQSPRQGDRQPARPNNGQQPRFQNQQRPQGQGPRSGQQGQRPQGGYQQQGQQGRPFQREQNRQDGNRPSFNNRQSNNQGRPQGGNSNQQRGNYSAGGNGHSNGNGGRQQGERRPQTAGQPAHIQFSKQFFNNTRPDRGNQNRNQGYRNTDENNEENGRQRGGNHGNANGYGSKNAKFNRNNGRNNMMNNNNNFGGGKNNKKNKNKNGSQPVPQPKAEIARPKHIKLGESIAVKDLASKMSYTAAEVIKKLMLMGVMASINQEIDFDTASLVAAEFDVTVEELPPENDPTEIPEIEENPKAVVLRPPVVTVMGHVDHGKTSLLDVIRKSSVSAHEAGGITQRIGAYQVMCQGKKIVFLDTPGHEAFTAMRARGAQVTDIAILVVAADDGVMPQTIEAINHAKSAKVPIIVAINKIDKPGANPDYVKQQLSEQGLVSEEWGGDTIMVPVSAKKQIGINDLLEMVLLVAEVQELKADPTCDARGVIIEAQLDKGRGTVATVLVQKGTLHIGDTIIAGTTYGKVRAMINDRGDNVRKAGPSMPVEVLGLSGVPEAGDVLACVEEKLARSIAEKRIEKQRNELIRSKKVSLDDLFQQIQEGNIKDLNILVKADVQGSVEALNSSLLQLNKNDEVRVSIIHSGVGAVNESDVMLASASNALILAFNVRPDANARRLADTENIDIRTYQVIYDALNDVKAAMSGMLAPKFKEVIQGKVEIRQVMKFSKVLVAGSYVLEGKVTNNSKIRIIRDNIVVFDGEIDSLRRFKDDVKEVAAGYECGLTIKDYRDFQEGDILEVYAMEEVATSIAEANAKAAERAADRN